jgi:hypothetical protein
VLGSFHLVLDRQNLRKRRTLLAMTI